VSTPSTCYRVFIYDFWGHRHKDKLYLRLNNDILIGQDTRSFSAELPCRRWKSLYRRLFLSCPHQRQRRRHDNWPTYRVFDFWSEVTNTWRMDELANYRVLPFAFWVEDTTTRQIWVADTNITTCRHYNFIEKDLVSLPFEILLFCMITNNI
jgi:hypothetical protein